MSHVYNVFVSTMTLSVVLKICHNDLSDYVNYGNKNNVVFLDDGSVVHLVHVVVFAD